VDCITYWAVLSLFGDVSSIFFTELETARACFLIAGHSLTCGVHTSFSGHISHYRKLEYDYGDSVFSFWAPSIDARRISWRKAAYITKI